MTKSSTVIVQACQRKNKSKPKEHSSAVMFAERGINSWLSAWKEPDKKKARYNFEYEEALVPRGMPRAFANASVNDVRVYRNL